MVDDLESVADEAEAAAAPGAVQTPDLSPVLDAISGLKSDVMARLDTLTAPPAAESAAEGADQDESPIPKKPWTHRPVPGFGKE